MNKNTFKKFGEIPIKVKKGKTFAREFAKDKRQGVVDDGLEKNAHTTYNHEVKFENIKARVNVTRFKDDDTDAVGVAKGAIMANVPVTVPSNTAAATMHAMKKRCDYKPSLEDIEVFKAGHEVIMSKFKPMETISFTQELFEQYLVKCAPGKSGRLLEALNSHQLNSDMDSKHVFAKQEVLLKEHQAEPRVVYQGSDMYNALTGPVVMELNNRMKTVFSRSNPLNTGNVVIYACGASGEELGDIFMNSPGEAIESDMKNNDGSQSGEFRKYEAMLYLKLGAPKWFVREFAKNTSVRVWTRYGVMATVEGQRWSGETTTTTGNSYVSMCLMQSALERASIVKSVNVHGGDDYLGYVEGDCEKLKTCIEQVTVLSGMKAEVVPKTRTHATFYRKRYPVTSIGCYPVPQHGRVLAKINIRANKNTNVDDRAYMSGKFYSAYYEHRHVPGIRELLRETAERLSDKPFFDVRAVKLAEMGGVENVNTIVEKAPVISIAEYSDFLQEVYGISYEDLVDVYSRVSQSCVDYCDGWTEVVNGKVKNRSKNHKYKPPVMGGDVIDALMRVDVLS